MVCIGIRGETGALKVAERCEYVAVKEPDNWQLRGIQGTVPHAFLKICLSWSVDRTSGRTLKFDRSKGGSGAYLHLRGKLCVNP